MKIGYNFYVDWYCKRSVFHPPFHQFLYIWSCRAMVIRLILFSIPNPYNVILANASKFRSLQWHCNFGQSLVQYIEPILKSQKNHQFKLAYYYFFQTFLKRQVLSNFIAYSTCFQWKDGFLFFPIKIKKVCKPLEQTQSGSLHTSGIDLGC